MRLCVISGAAAKRALTLHCGRRAQALSRVDVPRTQAVEFGSERGAINLFVYMQLAPPQPIRASVRQEEHDKSARAALAWSRFSRTQYNSATRCSGSGYRLCSCRVFASRPAKPCARRNLSRSIADAVRSDGSVYAAATRRIRKGLPQRGVAGAPRQISISIALLADAVNLAPCRPRGGPMPMAPSAMRHEQCCTRPQLAGQ